MGDERKKKKGRREKEKKCEKKTADTDAEGETLPAPQGAEVPP